MLGHARDVGFLVAGMGCWLLVCRSPTWDVGVLVDQLSFACS